MLGKTPSWALSDEQLLAKGPPRLRMAWVDTCLKPGPGWDAWATRHLWVGRGAWATRHLWAGRGARATGHSWAGRGAWATGRSWAGRGAWATRHLWVGRGGPQASPLVGRARTSGTWAAECVRMRGFSRQVKFGGWPAGALPGHQAFLSPAVLDLAQRRSYRLATGGRPV